MCHSLRFGLSTRYARAMKCVVANPPRDKPGALYIAERRVPDNGRIESAMPAVVAATVKWLHSLRGQWCVTAFKEVHRARVACLRRFPVFFLLEVRIDPS